MQALTVPLRVSMYCWFAFEVILAARDVARWRRHRSRDRGTQIVVSLSLGAAILTALLMRTWLPVLDTPGRRAFGAAGVAVLWLGLALRAWAVLTLGRSFRTVVAVDPDQNVVTRGPYRRIRHPAYTGLLLIALGFGLAAGNWLALAICALLPPLGLLPRILREESELVRVLGDRYRTYQRATRRLVPGLW